jgi:hypothetical protein
MLRRQRLLITWFVIGWTLLFHYETLRANYLSPLVLRLRSAQAGRPLPKVPLLFPPAGWIMFFNVDRSYGSAEVYGIHGDQPTLLDPHDIFPIKNVGYDNIRRNVLVSVLYADRAPGFCRYLQRKFPDYDSFAVVYAQYPDLIDMPDQVLRQVAYRCAGQ